MFHQSKCRPICHVIVLWAIKSELLTCHPLSAVLIAPHVHCKHPTRRGGKQIRVVKNIESGKTWQKTTHRCPIASSTLVWYIALPGTDKTIYRINVKDFRGNRQKYWARTCFERALDQIVALEIRPDVLYLRDIGGSSSTDTCIAEY